MGIYNVPFTLVGDQRTE